MSNILTKDKIRLHGQAVKTSPFHGGNAGSIPAGVTKETPQRRLWGFSLALPAVKRIDKSRFASRAIADGERHERSEYSRWSHPPKKRPSIGGCFFIIFRKLSHYEARCDRADLYQDKHTSCNRIGNLRELMGNLGDYVILCVKIKFRSFYCPTHTIRD